MVKFNSTEKAAFNQRHPKSPIKYWEAVQFNRVIDHDISIKILKFRYSHVKGVTFKPVR